MNRPRKGFACVFVLRSRCRYANEVLISGDSDGGSASDI